MFEVFDDTTPLVEGLSIDEAFLDVARAAADRAARPTRDRGAAARATVREQVGLPITVGVARTKFLAKVASGVAKPDGLLVVPPDGELEFLHPLPVERLWGVGAVTAEKLHDRGIAHGRRRRRARRGRAGLDARPRRPAASSTRWRTTATRGRCSRRPPPAARSGRSARSAARPHRPRRSTPSLVGLVDRRHRAACATAGRVGRTVMLRLRFDDFTRATRSHTLPAPTAQTRRDPGRRRGLLAAAHAADRASGASRSSGIAVAQPRRRRRRAARAAVRPAGRRRLDAALDDVRDRFGTERGHAGGAARPRPGLIGAAAARLTRAHVPALRYKFGLRGGTMRRVNAVLNPFVWDRPLDDPAKIIGMEAFANQVALTLKAQTNVALFGPRDTGKTTFTNQLALELVKRHGDDAPPFDVVKVNLQRVVSIPGFIGCVHDAMTAHPVKRLRRAAPAPDRGAGEGDRVRHQGRQGIGQARRRRPGAGRRDAARPARSRCARCRSTWWSCSTSSSASATAPATRSRSSARR